MTVPKALVNRAEKRAELIVITLAAFVTIAIVRELDRYGPDPTTEKETMEKILKKETGFAESIVTSKDLEEEYNAFFGQ